MDFLKKHHLAILRGLYCLLIAGGFLRVILKWSHQRADYGLFQVYHDFYVQLQAGKLPWVHFNFEYPPLSTPFIYGPSLFFGGLNPFQLFVIKSAWLFICLIGSLWCVTEIERLRKLPPVVSALAVAFISVAPAAILSTFDTWLLVIVSVALYFRVKQKEGISSNILLVGAFVKLMPAFFWLTEFVQGASALRTKKLWAFGVLTVAHIGYALLNTQGAIWAIKYQFVRPCDAFGTWTLIGLALSRGNHSLHAFTAGHGTLESTGTLMEVLSKVASVFTLVACIATFVYLARLVRASQASKEFSGFQIGACMVCVYIFMNKIGQPNYDLWVLTSVAVLLLCTRVKANTMAVFFGLTVLLHFFTGLQVHYYANLESQVVPSGYYMAIFGRTAVLGALSVMSALTVRKNYGALELEVISPISKDPLVDIIAEVADDRVSDPRHQKRAG